MAEIERKFLVERLPDRLGPGTAIRQAYLALDGQVEVRLRARGSARILTIKGGRGIERAEVSLGLGPGEFEELWDLARERSLTKTRHEVAVAGGTAEVDVYEADLAGLVVVEVEFGSRQAAEAFVPPDWFGPEVTDDERYSNARLAADGAPA